jgi:hypothetical protein
MDEPFSLHIRLASLAQGLGISRMLGRQCLLQFFSVLRCNLMFAEELLAGCADLLLTGLLAQRIDPITEGVKLDAFLG